MAGSQRTVVIRMFDALMRDIMAGWLATMSGYLVVGAVSAGPALTRLCALRSPDIALMQLGSAEAEELALVRGLRELRPAPAVIGLYGDHDPEKLLRFHRAGVWRLIGNRCGAAGLRTVLEETAPGRPAPRTHGALSGRELEVLALISAGCSTVDVASALEISPHTVINHTRRIFSKLDVHSRMQAAAEASRLGMRGTATQLRRAPVIGPSGPLRDEVARILAADLPEARPAVSVLVHPTESSWQADTGQSRKIVVVEPDNRDLVTDAVSRGARAVLFERDAAEQLPAVISLVRAGYLVATDEAVRPLLNGRTAPARYRLTPRERDILDSIALGHSVRETANALGIAVKTVQSEQRQLFAKLGVRNRPSALAYARDLGLVDT